VRFALRKISTTVEKLVEKLRYLDYGDLEMAVSGPFPGSEVLK